MSVGTSNTTVISSTKTEARNLNAIDASAAQRDDSSPATFPTTTPKNRQIYQNLKHCSTFLMYNDAHYHIPPVVIFPKGEKNQTNYYGRSIRAKADLGETDVYKETGKRGSERKEHLT